MANHLYQSLWLTHEKQGARARAYVTLFSLLWRCTSFTVAVCFQSQETVQKNCQPKRPFCWARPVCFDFSSFNFSVQGSHTQHCWGWMLLPNWLVHMSHLPLSLLNPGGICLSYFTPLERALTLWPERL
jgi:hypothetical protein